MTGLVITHCPHGLDLRLHARCFLCKPYQPGVTDPDGYFVIRPYIGPVGTGATTAAPWCGICQGWHIPGAGPCTGTYSHA